MKSSALQELSTEKDMAEHCHSELRFLPATTLGQGYDEAQDRHQAF